MEHNVPEKVHSDGERGQKGTQKTTGSTNHDIVSARTWCGEPSHLRVGPRGPITKANFPHINNAISLSPFL